MSLEQRLAVAPTTTATRKTPICDHLKVPGIDADFCPFCRIYYPAEVLAHAKTHSRPEPPKSPISVDVSVESPLPPIEESSPPEPQVETLPDEPTEPSVPSSASWHLAKAQTYLQLMNRIAMSSTLTPEAKRHEMSRLTKLRDEALELAQNEELNHA